MPHTLRTLLILALLAVAPLRTLRAEDLKQKFDHIRATFDAELDKAGESQNEQKKIIKKYALEFFKLGDANKGDVADQALIEAAAYYAMAADSPGVDTAMNAAMKRDLSWDSKILLLEASKDISSRRPQARSLCTGMLEEAAKDPLKAGKLAPILSELKMSNEAEALRKVVSESRANKSSGPDRAARTMTKESSANAANRRPAIPVSGKSVQTGRNISLSDFKGKVVLLDFWATWCGPCRAELPKLKKIYDTYHSRGLEIIGISADKKVEDLTSFIDKERMDWPQIADSANEGDRIGEAYKIQSIPMTYLIDRHGNLAASDLRGQELADAIATLLDER